LIHKTLNYIADRGQLPFKSDLKGMRSYYGGGMVNSCTLHKCVRISSNCRHINVNCIFHYILSCIFVMTSQNRNMCMETENLLESAILMFVVKTNDLTSYLRLQVFLSNTETLLSADTSIVQVLLLTRTLLKKRRKAIASSQKCSFSIRFVLSILCSMCALEDDETQLRCLWHLLCLYAASQCLIASQHLVCLVY
jgi:hypothetical protein